MDDSNYPTVYLYDQSGSGRSASLLISGLTIILLLGVISTSPFVAVDSPSDTQMQDDSDSSLNSSVVNACSEHTGVSSMAPATRPSVVIDISRASRTVSTANSSREDRFVFSRFNITYSDTASLTEFTVLTTDRGSVVSTRGLNHVGENTYQAHSNAKTVSITYEYNLTAIADDSELVGFYATPERELFSPVPQFRHGWMTNIDGRATPTCSYLLADDVRRTVTSADESTLSKTAVFLGAGPHAIHKTTTKGTTIRIVTPSTVSGGGSDRRQQLGQLVAVERAFRVNESVQHVTVFSINGVRDGGAAVHGGHANDSYQTVWVQRYSRVDSLGSTWVHEYIHTHQEMQLSRDMRWFTEASATYYGAVIPYQCGDYDPREFNNSMQTEMDPILPPGANNSVTEPYTETVLANPETWGSEAQYRRGAGVLYLLDVKLRDATDGEQTLLDVFRWMNMQDDGIPYADFRQHIVRQSNANVGRWLDTAVTTDARLGMAGITPPETGPMNKSACSVPYTNQEYDDGNESDESPAPPDGNLQSYTQPSAA